MHDFAALKQEEERILETQVQEREDALKRVEAFMSKREGIQSEINSITSETGAQSAGHLRAEANELDTQIRELENRLFEMKARHRHLTDEAQQLENSVQSKLSSYNASFDLLDKDIKRFLARPPIVQASTGIARNPVEGSGGSAESFYALTPKRRTLQMANDHWRDEREDLRRRKEAIEWEKTALQDGGRVWREVVTEIQTFEKDLKGQMQKLSMGPVSQQERDEGMTAVLNSMDKTMEFLERHLQEAEEKHWKLLICCMGAELEAFREGREILIDASGLRDTHVEQEAEQNGSLEEGDTSAAAPESPDEAFLPLAKADADTEGDSTLDYGYGTGSTVLSRPNPDQKGDGKRTSSELLPDLATARTRTGTGTGIDSRSSESELEDDDPGPDFLISHT